MKRTFILWLFLLIHTTLFAQKISYAIPSDYQNEISKKDYKKILNLSIKKLSERFKIIAVDTGYIWVQIEEQQSAFTIHNVLFKCSQESSKMWPAVVDAHFQAFFTSMDAQTKLDLLNFESIKDRIRLRVYPANYTPFLNGGQEGFATATVLENFYVAAVIDLPETIRLVESKLCAEWGKTVTEVLELGYQNTNKIEPYIETVLLGDSLEATFFEEGDYAASFALRIWETHPEIVGKYGTVIAIPNKGIFSTYKMEDPVSFVNFIKTTYEVTQKMHHDHTHPISTAFYWLYKGEFKEIPITFDADGLLNVISTPQMSTVLLDQN